jgi:phosphonopyruvate decarboxylase
MSGIKADRILEPAREMGFHVWTGVPCSYLKGLINYVIDAEGLTYISSANEGDAVATASGAALAGQRAVVMMQNSGLGNAISPLSSLNWVFRLPVLLIITLRGDPGVPDEPQHELLGKVTGALLDTLDIAWQWFPQHESDIPATLESATTHMDSTGLPFALLMRKGTIAEYALRSAPDSVAHAQPSCVRVAQPEADQPSRQAVLEQVVSQTSASDCIVIGSTGYNGRELYAIEDRPNHLYMVGSMGCAASLGLGLSLARPDLHTVVCDGDGGLLMRMGNLATIGAYGGVRFKHLLLDNGTHESTGGQATVSRHVDFTAVAHGCGYPHAEDYSGNGAIGRFLARSRGPGFMHIHTRAGVPPDLPRPSHRPASVKQRLMRQFGFDCAWRDLGV